MEAFQGDFMATTFDVCDVRHIYNEGYQYSLPQKILEGFLAGTEFGYSGYTTEEVALLKADINQIFQRIISLNPPKNCQALITAGAPGAGKTTLLRAQLKADSAYIDPDDVCLRQMELTYQTELAAGMALISAKTFTSNEACEQAVKELREKLYAKWRPGSNAACHFILANLIREKIEFYYGTTATAPQTRLFFNFLKQNGYAIHLLHLSAPDQVRWDSIQERDKTFIQTTQEDIFSKGKLLPERIRDTYLALADTIAFYFRAVFDEPAVLAATWIRGKGLHVNDSKAYEAVQVVHNKTCPDELKWEKVF